MKGRPTVGIVVPGVQTEVRGGINSSARWLVESMRADGALEPHVVSVATSSRDAASVLVRRPSTWHQHEMVTTLATDFGAVPHFGACAGEFEIARYQPRRVLTEYLDRFDLVYVLAGTAAFGNVARHVRRPLALQIASTVRMERGSGQSPSWGLRGLYRAASTRATSALERKALRRADRVFVMNERMRKECSINATAPVFVVPPGIDTERFAPRPGGVSGNYVLSVGRLYERRKNFGGLVDAFALARRDYGLRLPLKIAGAGAPPPDLLHQIRRLGLQDIVEVCRDVSDDALVELYRGARLFALPSHEEGLGLVYLEALSCGVPIVATMTEGAKQIFTMDGIGVPVPLWPDGLRPFARAIAEVSEDRADPGSYQAVRTAVVSDFSYAAAYERMRDELVRMIDAGARL